MGLFEAFAKAIKAALGLVTIYVINTLDQDVIVQVKGNRVQSTSNASGVGASFTIPAGKSDYRTLIAEQSGVLPYIYVELSCSTAPTAGNVTVYLIRGRDEEEKLVDALEIRDTAVHTPDTDPDKIFIRRWW
jgi:hypothetical protein